MIGRASTSALLIDDPRVSEAHAIVSLRHGELYILALRRMVGFQGRPVSEVRLEPGIAIELADELTLTVEDVRLPDRISGLRTAGAVPCPLGSVASIHGGDPPRVAARFVPDADAHLWSLGHETWRVRVGEGRPRTLAVGDGFDVGGHRFELCAIDRAAIDQPSTLGAGGVATPLRIVAHDDSVEIHRHNRPIVTVSGMGGRVLSELIAVRAPVAWEVISRELWHDSDEPTELRRRWDVTIGRLRARLREVGVRADLVRSDGSGQIQLLLYDSDRVEHRA